MTLPRLMSDELPSKTQRKREMHELQDLGAELVALNDAQLAAVELPEHLHGRGTGRAAHPNFEGRAPADCSSSASSCARRCRADPRTLAAWKAVVARADGSPASIERWRERLLEDDTRTDRAAGQHPQADAQRLRPLVRNAQREQAAGQPPKSFRALFQLLNQTIVAERETRRREQYVSVASRLQASSSRAIYSRHDERQELLIGLVSISDRASRASTGTKGIPALEEWFGAALAAPAWRTVTRLIPDEQPVIEATLQRARRRRTLSSGSHHRRHRPCTARRDTGSNARGRGQGDARASASRCGRSASSSCRPRFCRGRSQ